MTSLGEWAVTYARLGWPIFRLQPGTKLPFKGSHGHKDATTDLAVITRWWDQSPTANIGVACGTGTAPIVCDADGEGGLVELRRLCGGRIPETLAARTARGGWHFFYRTDQAIRTYNAPRPHSGADGLDIKAAGGYVLLAPSMVKGKAYSWANWGRAAANLPAGVVAHALSRGKGAARKPGGNVPALPTIARPRPAWIQAVSGGPAGLAERGLAALAMGELPDLLGALRLLPAVCSYNEWFEIGAGIHDWDAGPRGLAVFRAWSWQSVGHRDRIEGGCCEQKWAEYEKKAGQQGLITKRSLYDRANKILAERARAALAGGTGDNDNNTNGLREPAESGVNISEEAGANQEQGLGEGGDTGVSGIGAGGESPPLSNGVHALPEALTKVDEPIRFIDLDKGGRAKATCVNTRVAIRALGLACSYDTFHERLLMGGQEIGQWAGELSDNAVQALRKLVHGRFGFDPGSMNASDAAVQECLGACFDPVRDYLDRLVWDGMKRLDGWLARYMGAEGSELNRWFGRLALIAAVRRVRVPGSKFDHIIVLEGEEGRLKSSAIRVLAGDENFSDQSILTLSDARQQEALKGVWLYEIAELAGLGRADAEKVKAFASRMVDRARPAYGRHRIDKPRRCVFFATTNDHFYLHGLEGNRRFWPVKCGRVEIEALRRDRDQLWAEAASVEKSGLPLVLPEALWGAAREVQEGRETTDPWASIIENPPFNNAAPELWATGDGGQEYRISSQTILDLWLAIPRERQQNFTQKRISVLMRKNNWVGPYKLRVNKGAGENPVRGFSKRIK